MEFDLSKINLSKELFNELVIRLQEEGLAVHSIMMMYNDDVIFEKYFKPFDENFLHRMYSQTKSFMAVALMLLVEDGKVNLQDPVLKYFPEYNKPTTHKWLKEQTIENMLMMETSVQYRHWFIDPIDNRVELYFDEKVFRPAGLWWEYDSAGSQVLSALVERVSGMKLFDFLNERIFKGMGTFKNARILQVPCDQSWGDSGLLCTQRDLASFGRLCMQYGVYKGKRYVSEELMRKATSNLTGNNEIGYTSNVHQGYGYQFWRLKRNGFGMTGMGDQLTMMFPDCNFLFSCTCSNENAKDKRELIYGEVYKLVDKIMGRKIEEPTYELRSFEYNPQPKLMEKINDVTYVTESDYAFKEFSISFKEDYGIFKFNYHGEYKEIKFGLGHNEFGKFPVDGYSDEVGKFKCPGNKYDIATSCGFDSDKKIIIDVKVIDKYFGNLFIMCAFKDEYAWVKCQKYSEFFMVDFVGQALFTKK